MRIKAVVRPQPGRPREGLCLEVVMDVSMGDALKSLDVSLWHLHMVGPDRFPIWQHVWGETITGPYGLSTYVEVQTQPGQRLQLWGRRWPPDSWRVLQELTVDW